MLIRIATADDLPAIDAIYNQGIAAGQTADLQPLTEAARRQWFAEHEPALYPLWVAETEEGVVGWLSLSAYRKGRQALRFVAEVSYYLDRRSQGQGIGSQLMAFGLEAARELGYRHLLAILLENNAGSIALLRKFGFTQWGLLPGIADCSGRSVGHLYYGRSI